ncbi:hypothetical protein SAMN05192534_1497 [Alteribacillus persepolensis]|uniref:Uncharacterized protein n=1 Tax=Alteribacillus persepolensis TaxID=568899 RepID=A0A1G8KH56_9BACI|nr:hypothetical protein [Alteribacillus persepolensis]SDI42783.1 hypothetical protein SAMN05192534_1497 [Alteribacillus persepolensis]
MKQEDFLQYLDTRIQEIKYTETDHREHSLVLLGSRLAYQEIKQYIENQTKTSPDTFRLYSGMRKE